MDYRWKEFAQLLLAGEDEGAFRLISEDGRDSLAIYMEIVTNAMQYVGYLWQNNEISVADEHLATSVCDFVLSRYSFSFRNQQKKKIGKIMFLCLEKEQHMLGTKMAAALCEEKNWDVRLLGANLPLEYAISSAESWEPDVIGLSVALHYRLPVLKRYVKELEALEFSPKVIIGGRLASTYDLYNYCSKETELFKDLYAMDAWLDEYRQEVKVNGAS
ncbi:cobalamin B12-binding domain-containing protein [Sediminibacillus massiliensis]|uniref:cobalamin B12-binding domain-containing protein n=1 Tax=Sediminibacillus massiliensis TaxID=1926277 RepID=UPI0009886888|nr:cobalamin-dependent protein [Sediminibacillus massiliensis]